VPARSPEERSLIARIAITERWAREPDRAAATAPARAGLRGKYAREVDPDGVLTEADREHRVDQLMHAHMLRMTLRAKVARRKVAGMLVEASAADAALEEIGAADVE
jgi:hypothetical protein